MTSVIVVTLAGRVSASKPIFLSCFASLPSTPGHIFFIQTLLYLRKYSSTSPGSLPGVVAKYVVMLKTKTTGARERTDVTPRVFHTRVQRNVISQVEAEELSLLFSSFAWR
jgi:hypothetical protein